MSLLGPMDRTPEKLFATSYGTMSKKKDWRTEYKDEYSEPQVAEGVPDVRTQMAGINDTISSLTGRHSTMHGTFRLPPGHPPAAAYNPQGSAVVGTMTRGSGTISSLKDSCLYDKEKTWANWRVDVEGKPAEQRRKYRARG